MREPLVLLPGLLCDRRLFAPQLAGIPTTLVRQMGDLTRDRSIDAMAEQVLDTAPRRFALCGLSMGGYVALEIVRRAPERVARLALLATRARGDSEEERQRRHALIALAEEGHFEEAVDRILPLLVHPHRTTDKELVETIRAMASSVGPEAFVRQQQAILDRKDRTAELAEIRLPTLVLCGREDRLTPPEFSLELAQAIPDATLIVLPRCGHLASLERPAAVTAQLRAWIGA
jgi:pimeloyl-ACP methyl ester carboxylesterase